MNQIQKYQERMRKHDELMARVEQRVASRSAPQDPAPKPPVMRVCKECGDDLSKRIKGKLCWACYYKNHYRLDRAPVDGTDKWLTAAEEEWL